MDRMIINIVPLWGECNKNNIGENMIENFGRGRDINGFITISCKQIQERGEG